MDTRAAGRLRCSVPSIRLLVAGPLLALLAADAYARDRADALPNVDAWRSAPPVAATPVDRGVAVARDPGRGVPTLLWTPGAPAAPRGASAELAARVHLERHAREYGVSRAALAGLRTRLVHDTGRGGIVVVLRQSVAGVDVFHGDVKLLLDRDHRLVAIAGAPHPAGHPAAVRPFARTADAAVRTALRDLHGDLADAAKLAPTGARGGWQHLGLASPASSTTASAALRFDAPARVRPVHFPVGEALVPGHLVELQTAVAGRRDVFQYVIAADDGRVLYRHDATADEAFSYRVWADADGDMRPLDGPLVDWNPYPTKEPGEGPKDAAAPALVTIEGFNTNPDGEADPWLPPGALETLGNNVDAYVDHDSPDGLTPETEFRAKVTAPGVFDRVYDIALEPLANGDQSMASITMLFYVNNWMHDWWYDSGFDEAAGNAQTDNFGRGGADNDVLRAEAQDAAISGARNNANMSTPLDGASPRMQMYLWSGLELFSGVTIEPLDQDIKTRTATFGPATFDVTAPLILINDGMGKNGNDGCEPPANDLKGKIALIDRGNCTFEAKVTKAQAAGAVGVLIVDNVDAAEPPTLGNDVDLEDPTLPTLGMTMAVGAGVKAALANGAQTAHMAAASTVERDGTIDNMIVAHEWGHYLHHRLVECGNQACGGMSEGWGDFNALLMSLREGDDMHATFALDSYASFDTTGYFGIRRVPYSVDMTRNALSFRHIGDGAPLPDDHPWSPSGGSNSEVHNVGEVWATMMWEAYIALHEAHGDMSFDEVRRLMSDYVVAGMLMAPADPTFTEQRDALMMAAAAASEADMMTLAEAFARRGAGSCAVSPPKDSTTLVGVVEDFGLDANGVLLDVRAAEVTACDGDGVLDLGEVGRVDVDVYNGGVVTLPAGATVAVVDADPALVFVDGPTVTLPELGPLEQTTVSLAVKLDPEFVTANRALLMTVRLTNPAGCEPTRERALPLEIHADVAPAVSATDDVEADATVWALNGGGADIVWKREYAGTDRFWRADDVGHPSDTRLVSPPLEVDAAAPLVITFDHAFSFERSDDINWDGGLIELSRDDGKTWEDISTFTAETGYTGAIGSAENPLDKRPAYVGTNKAYPQRETQTLDLGTQLAGETVLLRFRVGTDAAAGAPGWEIDDIAFAGITNTPFGRWTLDAGLCAPDDWTPTTGDEDSQGDDDGATPTTTASDGEAGPNSSGESGSTDAAGEAGGQVSDDDGCGCVTSERGGLARLAPLLLPLLLRRRRRASLGPT